MFLHGSGLVGRRWNRLQSVGLAARFVQFDRHSAAFQWSHELRVKVFVAVQIFPCKQGVSPGTQGAHAGSLATLADRQLLNPYCMPYDTLVYDYELMGPWRRGGGPGEGRFAAFQY
jgi:hypothetical protein